jgi:hypothetical protein
MAKTESQLTNIALRITQIDAAIKTGTAKGASLMKQKRMAEAKIKSLDTALAEQVKSVHELKMQKQKTISEFHIATTQGN